MWLSHPPPTLHTWTLHPCGSAIKDKKSPVLWGIRSSGCQVLSTCDVSRSSIVLRTRDMKNTRSKKAFILASKTGEGIPTSPAPPFFSSIRGNNDVLAAVGAARHSLLAGYSFGEWELGVGWPTLLAFSPMEYFFVCLLPFFSLASSWSVPIIFSVIVIHTEPQQKIKKNVPWG